MNIQYSLATQGTPYQNLDALLHSDYNFTVRQQEVLALIAEGRSNKEIASILEVSTNTVRTKHIREIMRKTDAESSLELVVLAYTGKIPRLMDGYGAMKGPSDIPDIPYNSSADLSKYNLTNREKEVLNHVAIGRSNKEIASILEVSTNTVRTKHIREIMRKTDAESSLELVVLAYTGNIPRLME